MPDFSYQDEDIAYLRDHPRCALLHEPGLGKSRMMLEAAVEPVLVIAPAMVLDSGTWDDEIDRWAPGLDVTQVPWTSLNDRERIRCDWVDPSKVCAKCKRARELRPEQPETWAHATRAVERLRPELRRQWGTVLADEWHMAKGRKTTWTKVVSRLQTERFHPATGTALPNWAHEAFTLCQNLYPEKAKPGQEFGAYWRWVGQWFQVGGNGFTKHAIGDPLEDNPAFWLRFFEQNLGERVVQRLRDDVLTDLPPMTNQWVKCPMTREQRRIYESLKADYVTWTQGGNEIAAWSDGELHMKLLKVCTGVELLDPATQASTKFDQFQMRVANQARQSLAVGWFQPTVELAADRVRAAGKRAAVVHGGVSSKSRGDIIRAFKSGQIDVLCASISTIKEGLTLNQADTIHMLERSVVPSHNKQVVRRCHRIGQTRPVTVYNYVTPGSLDENQLPAIAAKSDQQMKALRAREFAALL
ncbi:MAG: DEAD/DEAH box helicase [Gemmatimonadota bacterium]|nr:DEAD/DEAH box helicase [Gemmatimonadota bacterium]